MPGEATQGQGGGHQAKPSAATSKQHAAGSKDSEASSEQRVPKAGRSQPAALPPAPPTTVKQPESRQSPFGLFGAGPLQAGLRTLSGRLKGALAGGLLNYCSMVFWGVHVGVWGGGRVRLGMRPPQSSANATGCWLVQEAPCPGGAQGRLAAGGEWPHTHVSRTGDLPPVAGAWQKLCMLFWCAVAAHCLRGSMEGPHPAGLGCTWHHLCMAYPWCQTSDLDSALRACFAA